MRTMCYTESYIYKLQGETSTAAAHRQQHKASALTLSMLFKGYVILVIFSRRK